MNIFLIAGIVIIGLVVAIWITGYIRGLFSSDEED